MKYNWNIEKIRFQRQQTKDLLRKTDGLNKEEKLILKQIIQSLKTMEKSLLGGKTLLDFPERIKYMDSNKMLSKDTYLSYNEIPYYLIESILNAYGCLQDYSSAYEVIELPELKISEQELVEMSHNFFNWLPKQSYLKDFERFINPKNNLLRFTYNEQTNLFGETSFFYYPEYRPYFSIDREESIADFITLNHEIAHGIMYRHDNTISFNSQHYFLMELEGSFFDFLSIEYLKKFMNLDIIQNLEYNRFINSYEDLISFYVTDYAIKLFDDGIDISIIPIQNKILEDELLFDLDETFLLRSLSEDPKVTAKYLISYLTSLDLEIIYERDPEYAFYIFERIRNNKTNDLFQNLKDNDISFIGDKENYVPLQKTIQKMNHLRK